MGWRHSRRDSILKELWTSAGIEIFTEWLGTASASVSTLTSTELSVSAGPVFREFSVLSTTGPLVQVETAFLPRFHDIEVCLVARLAVLPFLESPAIAVCVVNLVITAPKLMTHSFLTRSESKSRLFGASPARKAPRPEGLPPQSPPPPPGLDKKSLEERLRWILTPPIQELLRESQLSLPHEPYKHQQYGIKWLMDREHALLADEMGLGKTMQAIIAARLLWRAQQIKRLLIICPKTLIRTWLDEIELWWPSAIDNTRVIESRPEYYLRLATDNVTIQIINYERLARLADSLDDPAYSCDLIVIDEAQRIKNPKTSTARAVKALGANRRWALTGTPLENRVGDVVSIFEFVRRGLLGNDDAEHVRATIRPYMLRRRTEVLQDLPALDARDVAIEMTTRQREAYNRAENEGVVALNERGDTITVQHVFALIQKLMQICNFDAESGESGKLARLAQDLEEIVDSGRKALVFSRFVSPPFGLRQLDLKLPDQCNSETPLVCVSMHGEVRPGERESNLKRFSEDPAINVMLLNYAVGGVGLNLQVANYVYLFDRWWNPAVEDQAMARAHRLGQERKVFVRRFFTPATIEDRILRKVADKRRLFEQVIDSDRATPGKMGLSEEEVFQLFEGLQVRPRRSGSKEGPVRMQLSSLSPNDFEEITARIYEKQGFRVERRGGSNDKGIDLIAERSQEGASDHLRVAVQCKRYNSKVGPAPVRELLGVLADDQTFHRADLITSADFSSAARTAAFGHRLELINGAKFRELARKYGVAVFDE